MSYSGEAVFLRIHDLGGTFEMTRVRAALGSMAVPAAVQSSKTTPENVSYAAPITLNLASLKLDVTTDEGAAVTVMARLYEVGALAVLLRIPVKADTLHDLNRYQTIPLKLRGQPAKRAEIGK